MKSTGLTALKNTTLIQRAAPAAQVSSYLHSALLSAQCRNAARHFGACSQPLSQAPRRYSNLLLILLLYTWNLSFQMAVAATVTIRDQTLGLLPSTILQSQAVFYLSIANHWGNLVSADKSHSSSCSPSCSHATPMDGKTLRKRINIIGCCCVLLWYQQICAVEPEHETSILTHVSSTTCTQTQHILQADSSTAQIYLAVAEGSGQGRGKGTMWFNSLSISE